MRRRGEKRRKREGENKKKSSGATGWRRAAVKGRREDTW